MTAYPYYIAICAHCGFPVLPKSIKPVGLVASLHTKEQYMSDQAFQLIEPDPSDPKKIKINTSGQDLILSRQVLGHDFPVVLTDEDQYVTIMALHQLAEVTNTAGDTDFTAKAVTVLAKLQELSVPIPGITTGQETPENGPVPSSGAPADGEPPAAEPTPEIAQNPAPGEGYRTGEIPLIEGQVTPSAHEQILLDAGVDPAIAKSAGDLASSHSVLSDEEQGALSGEAMAQVEADEARSAESGDDDLIKGATQAIIAHHPEAAEHELALADADEDVDDLAAFEADPEADLFE